jgi:5'-nucleotidase (lipoprotein e(P4) family)
MIGKWILAAVVFGGAGFAVSHFAFPRTPPQEANNKTAEPNKETPPTAKADTLGTRERLLANLYQQIAPEYAACCRTIYKSAELRLEHMLKDSPKGDKPYAIVMDLDETVFDNSAFAVAQQRDGREYSDDLWEIYERDFPNETRLMAGAKEFIAFAESKGVTPIYLSNRLTLYTKQAADILKREGIDTKNIDERMLFKLKGGGSDKTARRKQATDKFQVIMYFGDNLRDFDEKYRIEKKDYEAPEEKARELIQTRMTTVEADKAKWGIEWFVFPNPTYGEWDRMAGKEPKRLFRPTKIQFGK